MIDDRTAPYGALLLRLSLGGLFIAHLYAKFAIEGASAWWTSLEGAGAPSWAIYYATSAEFAGAILIVLGIFTRWVSLYVLPLVIATTYFWATRKGFFWFTEAGYEFPLVWSLLLVVQALLGDGAYALRVTSLLRRRRAPPEAAQA